MDNKTDMIYDLVKETRDDVRAIKTDLKNGAVKMENHEGRIGRVETDVSEIKEMTIEHVRNKKKHYNMGYKETVPQKIWRKKVELGLLGIILFLIERATDYYLSNGGTP